MIEVLIAMLIFSVGLISLAGLQTRAMRDNHSALLRSVAVQRAEDILDRMRANPEAAFNGQYDVALDFPDPGWEDFPELLNELASSGYSGVALNDLAEWKAALSGAFPAGAGSVAVDGTIAIVEIRWAEGVGDQAVRLVTKL